jgi:hypothetical protein
VAENQNQPQINADEGHDQEKRVDFRFVFFLIVVLSALIGGNSSLP